MDNDRNDRRRISRRAVLTRGTLAFGAAAAAMAAPRAAAQQKIGKTDAQYQTSPKDGQHCGVCANFQAPNTCKFVQGDISPNGWCQLFAQKT